MNIISLPTDIKLKTKRLLMRYPEIGDAGDIYSVIISPLFPEQLPLKELNEVTKIEEWLKRLQENWVKGQAFSWIVEVRDSGKLIGQNTLSRIKRDDIWALAFWTHPESWGNGYATEGAERILAFGFEDINASKIWAGAGEWNKGSMRVLEKIGMKYTGLNPEGYYLNGESITTYEYEISKGEWQTRTRR